MAHVCFDQSRNEVTEDQWCLELPQPLPEHKPCAMEPCLYRLVFPGAQLNSCFSLPLNPGSALVSCKVEKKERSMK